jgi:hypothetical protein
MTYVMWREESLWNVSALQKYTFPVLLSFFLFKYLREKVDSWFLFLCACVLECYLVALRREWLGAWFICCRWHAFTKTLLLAVQNASEYVWSVPWVFLWRFCKHYYTLHQYCVTKIASTCHTVLWKHIVGRGDEAPRIRNSVLWSLTLQLCAGSGSCDVLSRELWSSSYWIAVKQLWYSDELNTPYVTSWIEVSGSSFKMLPVLVLVATRFRVRWALLRMTVTGDMLTLTDLSSWLMALTCWD